MKVLFADFHGLICNTIIFYYNAELPQYTAVCKTDLMKVKSKYLDPRGTTVQCKQTIHSLIKVVECAGMESLWIVQVIV